MRKAALVALSVSSTPGISEGFFGECSVSGNVISVTCSGSTTALTARPAALSVLPDSAVTVHSLGGGAFAVVIDASGLPSYADRTRTILTLGASNANGTTVYKDLSLRFSAETEGEEYVAVRAVTVEDGAITLAIPYGWFVDEGLVAAGSAAAAYEAAAAADSDGDGAANWEEYLCGTDPNDATKFFMATIRMANGEAVVGHNLDETELAEKGFHAVVQGKALLTDSWSVRSTAHRFFRVVVEPVD